MRAFDIAFKDLVSGFRNRFSLMMMLVLPLLITGLIYVAFGGLSSGNKAEPGLETVRIAVVNLDQGDSQVGNLGRVLDQFLGSEELARIISVTEMNNETAAREAVSLQRVALAVIIPPGFSAAMGQRQAGSTVLIVQDPTLTVGPQIVQEIIQHFLDGLSGARIATGLVGSPGLKPDAGPSGIMALGRRYGEIAESLGRSGAAVLAVRPPAAGAAKVNPMAQVIGNIMAGMLIYFAFYTAAYTAMSVLREDEQGTLARLFTTPVDRGTILGGKLLSVFLTVLVQVVVLMTASALIFHINWGTPASVVLAVAGSCLCAGGFGILLISFVRDTRQAGPVLGGALSVAGMLGGLFTAAVPNMPAAFKTVALAMPQGWAMRILSLSIAGRVPQQLVVTLIVLLVIGAASFLIGTRVFRRRFA